MTDLQEDIIFIKNKIFNFISFVRERDIKILKCYIEYFYSDDIENIIFNDLEAFLVNAQEMFNDCAEKTARIDVLNEITQTTIDIYRHSYESLKMQSQVKTILFATNL